MCAKDCRNALKAGGPMRGAQKGCASSGRLRQKAVCGPMRVRAQKGLRQQRTPSPEGGLRPDAR